MNDFYAVDPAAPTSVQELAALLGKFGPYHGRFIADFPLEWRKHALMRAQGLGDLDRKRWASWLEKSKGAFLPVPLVYRDSIGWADNAAFLLNDVVGLLGPVDATPPCKSLRDVLTDPDAFPDSGGDHVPRTALHYAKVARPLFQLSNTVVLVDPYFKLRYRDKNDPSREVRIAHRQIQTLKTLLSAAKKARKVEVFRLNLSAKEALIDEDDGAALEADLKKIREDLDCDITIEYDLLDPSHSFDKHPRYLLGNYCGLKFDYGFDTNDDGSTNHVAWIGQRVLEPLLTRFL